MTAGQKTVRPRIRLDDVAERAGVSSITVSRAFRLPHKVSPELRQQIHAIADELGYVPNRAASALASNRSMNIAVIIPSLSNNVFVDTVRGVEAVLRPRGYQMLLGVSNYSPDEEAKLVRAYLGFDPDGILLTGFNYRETQRQMIEQAGVPVVHMMELSDHDGDYAVGFSQPEAGRAMTRHLIQSGRKRIAFVASQLDPRTNARARGFRDTMVEAQLYDSRRELLAPDPSSIALGGVLLNRLLKQAPDTDAIFFCNDDLAQGALLECLRQGISVPEELAIAGFNDLPASACMVPSLTSIATPRYEVGEEAAKMLISIIDGRKPSNPQLDLGFKLQKRGST